MHSDLRLANLVWLDNEHCMLIDLENCRRASAPVPDGFRLKDWDNDTLEKGPGKTKKRYYTPASDLYHSDWSYAARCAQAWVVPGSRIVCPPAAQQGRGQAGCEDSPGP